jgi:hypothetical protein
LLVSDDRSSDGTAELLHDYQRRDARIEILPPRSGAAEAVANFEYLLRAAADLYQDSDCVLLCDQDDVWVAEKLALQTDALRSAQACYSDLSLIDAAGVELATSFLSQLNTQATPGLSDLFAQNPVVGCSLAVRSEVLNLALPFPEGLMNHDWWLAVCALALGDLARIDKPLVRYRQHAGNAIGAYRPAHQLMRLPALLARQRRVLRGQVNAAATLAERLTGRGLTPPDTLRAYEEYVGHGSLLRRLSTLASGEFAAPHSPLRYLRCCAAIRKLV